MKGFYTEKILGKFRDAYDEAVAKVKSGEEYVVRISKSNSKMGDVASVSMLPFLTCPSCCKDSCGEKCYAAKIANLYPTVLKSYAVNTALAIYRPLTYWHAVNDACSRVPYFRFHVSGDILNLDYLYCMIDTAKRNPDTQMLCFTKKYSIVNTVVREMAIPENLHILLSGWTNLVPNNPFLLPETNVVEHGAEPDPSWTMCGGNCYNCAKAGCGCWTAKRGDVIAFPIH